MKNKNISKLVAVVTLVAMCGLTTGCGLLNVQELAQRQEDTQGRETKESNEAKETREEVKEESKETSQEASANFSGDWTSMEFELNGKNYKLPFAYKDLEAEGWSFDLADYGYTDGYAMEPGDKVFATIYLNNPAYDEDLQICVGFKNYSDSVLDIKECDVWSFELDTTHGSRQLPSYPSMTIGNGLAIGSSKSDIEKVCGVCDDIYESSSLGYVEYSYNEGDYNLSVTAFEDMGITAFELSTYE